MSSKLMFDKFEGAGFKYDDSFYKIPAKKYANKAFLVPDLGIFILVRNITIKQILGH